MYRAPRYADKTRKYQQGSSVPPSTIDVARWVNVPDEQDVPLSAQMTRADYSELVLPNFNGSGSSRLPYVKPPKRPVESSQRVTRRPVLSTGIKPITHNTVDDFDMRELARMRKFDADREAARLGKPRKQMAMNLTEI